jgi:hypothetical protein
MFIEQVVSWKCFENIEKILEYLKINHNTHKNRRLDKRFCDKNSYCCKKKT